MEKLNLEKFSPTKAELIKLCDEAKGLEIKGVDDKEGYNLVHSTRMKFKNTRVALAKIGKQLRTDSLAFQKAVIVKEKELIAVIEPTEIELANKQKLIDEEKEMIERQKLLPERKAKLEEIEMNVVDDDFILLMDDIKFDNFYNNAKAEYLEKKEAKIKEENERIEQEKRDKVIREEAEKKAREEEKERLELAKKQAELDKQKAVEDEKRKARELEEKKEKEKQEAIDKAEAEKQTIIDENRRKEKQRLINEDMKRREEEEKIRAEQLAKEKKEKTKKYQNFLTDNGYTEKTKDNFYILRNGNQFTLYKKINSIIIK